MSLRSPTDNEKCNPTTHSITLQTLTSIQTSPVEGEGSAPPLDGEDTRGVQQTAKPQRRSTSVSIHRVTKNHKFVRSSPVPSNPYCAVSAPRPVFARWLLVDRREPR